MNLSGRVLQLSRPFALVVVLSLYMVWDPAPSMPLMALYAVSAAFFIMSSALLFCWIPAPRSWFPYVVGGELLLAGLLNLAGNLTVPGGPMVVLLSPIAVTLDELPRPQRVAASALLFVAWVGTRFPFWLTVTPKQAAFDIGVYGSLLLFSGSVGWLLRNYREAKDRSERLLKQVTQSQAALERAHRQLQESAAQQQHMAVIDERQRLAREIHDSVAHGLTALVVQIQAARRLLDRAPDQAAETIARCEEMAREALLETRRAVRALHPSGLEQQSEVDALRRLGRDFGIATGMEVQVTADESVGALSVDARRLEQLYRIFQEALTNAHRHGQAHQVDARLSVDGAQLSLSIRNDGLPPATLEPGVGLKSMEERVRSLGGRIRFVPEGHGLAIYVTVPLHQEAVS